MTTGGHKASPLPGGGAGGDRFRRELGRQKIRGSVLPQAAASRDQRQADKPDDHARRLGDDLGAPGDGEVMVEGGLVDAGDDPQFIAAAGGQGVTGQVQVLGVLIDAARVGYGRVPLRRAATSTITPR